MKELRSILATIEKYKSKGLRIALATVVHVEDSSYRRSGARMLIIEDGTWIGGISGGCLEGDTLLKAQKAIVENKTITVRYDTRENDEDQIGVGLGCNGLIDVLITPIDTVDLALLKRSIDQRAPRIIITVVESNSSEIPVGSLIDPLQSKDICDRFILTESMKLVKKSGTSRTVVSQGNKFFIEYIVPVVRLIICGKNYDTLPLARIAKEIGWSVFFYTNPSKLNKMQYAVSDQVVDYRNAELPVDPYTAVIIMAHDYKTDISNLQKTLKISNLPYVGVLGPKKRSIKMYQELDLDQDQLPQLHAPVGLDTGATTPEEIAISIIAEIRTVFSGRDGGKLRTRIKPINQ